MTAPDFKAVALRYLQKTMHDRCDSSDLGRGDDADRLEELLHATYNRGLEDAARECEAEHFERSTGKPNVGPLGGIAISCARRIRALRDKGE